VFQKWLISAVARALDPGCKADHVLILEGPQGVGKSTAVRTLCGDEYFGDTVPRLDTKDASDYVRGKWIIELAELSSVSKSAVEQVKAYITRTEEEITNEVANARMAAFARMAALCSSSDEHDLQTRLKEKGQTRRPSQKV